MNDRQQTPKRQRAHTFSRQFTLIVTNCIKLGGLVAALHEAFGLPHPYPIDMALYGFMMAGAQLSEELILRGLRYFFGFNQGSEEE